MNSSGISFLVTALKWASFDHCVPGFAGYQIFMNCTGRWERLGTSDSLITKLAPDICHFAEEPTASRKSDHPLSAGRLPSITLVFFVIMMLAATLDDLWMTWELSEPFLVMSTAVLVAWNPKVLQRTFVLVYPTVITSGRTQLSLFLWKVKWPLLRFYQLLATRITPWA